jgi:hypothetical protein
VSHNRCRHCGGPCAWYARSCWQCKEIELREIERRAEREAERAARVFADALGNPTDKLPQNPR